MSHYTLSNRMVSWVSQRFFRRNVYTARRGLARGLRREGGLGFLPESVLPDHESPEHACLRAIDYAGRVVYDVGAYEGLTTLFFASRGAVVHAFEPTPTTAQRLRRNLALNADLAVTVHECAVGSRAGRVEMAVDPLMAGGASAATEIASAITASTDTARRVSVEMITLDELHASGRLPPPDFVKIDVEGYEAEVLRGARTLLRTRRPQLFVELHGEDAEDKVRRTRDVLGEVRSLGYDRVLHVERGQLLPDADVGLEFAEGHLLVGSLPPRPGEAPGIH